MSEQSDSPTVCVSCKCIVATEDTVEHPWLYGSACLDCQCICKNILLDWSAGNSLQCETCDQKTGLTMFNYRLLCFNCVGEKSIRLLPKPRYDWIEKIQFSDSGSGTLPEMKNSLRVLSLFDGIGTGLLALDALGLEVEKYFSCEVDEAAVALLDFHYSERLQHLGSVTSLSFTKLRALGQIDLVIGGSPCNQLSLANPTRLGLYDPVESGVLFFDYNRILKFLQAEAMSAGVPLFWLYENVAAMPQTFKDTISQTLQSNPTEWDAIQYLPAKRARLFWGNIPGLHHEHSVDELPVRLHEVLEPYRRALVPTLPTITTTFHSQSNGIEMQLPVMDDGDESGLLITERERLFGFPPHYTDGPDLSIIQRQILLGRAWSVPVIEKIFAPLTKLYKMNCW